MNAAQTRFTTEGLVIKEMNVGESDRLVTLFTQEYGIIKAFAAGAKNIKFMCIIATEEGIEKINKEHPDVQIFCAAVDPEMNEQLYIVPGLGDAGDRMYGTK